MGGFFSTILDSMFARSLLKVETLHEHVVSLPLVAVELRVVVDLREIPKLGRIDRPLAVMPLTEVSGKALMLWVLDEVSKVKVAKPEPAGA